MTDEIPIHTRDAIFSDDRVYRYVLRRIWDSDRKPCMFIGLNPSTADETNDDPTVRRCICYAHAWGYGGLLMTNIFAFRATDPAVMKSHAEPIGPENDEWLEVVHEASGVAVAAWGTHGAHLGRAESVRRLLANLHYLRLTKDGHPNHPLYLPKTLIPLVWDRRTP